MMFVLASDPRRSIRGGFFGQRSSFASPAPVKGSCAANVTDLVRDGGGGGELKRFQLRVWGVGL